MKEFKSSVLKPKIKINANCSNQLFDFLERITDQTYRIEERSNYKLKGLIAAGNCFLSKPGFRKEKYWFVNEGMAFLYYYDANNKMSIVTLFGPGEIAIVPDIVKTSIHSETYLVVCKNAHLIEISIKNNDRQYKLYPDMNALTRLIISYQTNKHLQKDKLLSCKGARQVEMFCELFPHIDLYGAGINRYKKFIAAFMGIVPQSLSRNLKLYKAKLAIPKNPLCDVILRSG